MSPEGTEGRKGKKGKKQKNTKKEPKLEKEEVKPEVLVAAPLSVKILSLSRRSPLI
jgi:hypothetical protein